MFEPTSRYFKIEDATLSVTESDGTTRLLMYKRRRLIPPAEGMTTLVEHSVAQAERLDNITARYLGDSTQFWRVCDVNNVLHPEELEEVGRSVKIALPNV